MSGSDVDLKKEWNDYEHKKKSIQNRDAIINFFFILSSIIFLFSLIYIGGITITGNVVGGMEGNVVGLAFILGFLLLWVVLMYFKFQIDKIKKSI